ncbi:MAG: hypothetical protein L3J52_08210 [Proteobacteria bacterium]|nr:hypothetical protein [Pseudomonadota bacterium]
MPLSTFNSDPSQNNGSWIASWLLLVLMVFMVLFSYEQFLKSNSHRPSIDSTQDLWSWYRYQTRQKADKIVLLGASRMQLDINTDYLRTRFTGRKIIELSINGQYPMATLQALAEDQEFVGTVIISLNAQALRSIYHDMQISHNDYFNNDASRYRAFDAYLSAKIQSSWRFLHPRLSLEELVDFYDDHRKYPKPFYVVENADLSKSADFSLTNIEKLLKHFVNSKSKQYQDEVRPKPAVWSENLHVLNGYVDAIRERGGQVILVRLPTDKGHWHIDEQYYPRAVYWDKLAEKSHAGTIHFKDVEGLEQFDLPDSSNLDQKDSEKFTAILFDHIDELW